MPKKLSLLLFILFSISWFACKKVDINFGDQYLDNGYTQVVKVDTFAADLSTVYVDSFPTSGNGVTILGNYKDPVFGTITNNTYFEVVPPSTVQSTDYVDSLRSVTFDSLALVLVPNHTYIGDTSKPVHIDVNRLAEAIVPYENTSTTIYNTRTFAVQTPSIGSKDAVLRPTIGDSIFIRLDDNLGKTLLSKLQNPNDADLRTNQAFLQYLFGFRLSSTTNQLSFGAKDSVVMRLYYKKPGLYLENRIIDFTLANNAHHFVNVSVDRSGTVLKDLATLKQINSKSLGNTAYTMYAAGAMTKIRFPSIRDILKLPNYAKILKATLIVRPIRGTYGTGSYVLPPAMRLSTTTQLNQIGTDLVSFNSSGTAVTQTGNLSVDLLYGENTGYTYDLSSYIKTIVQDGTINANGLLLIPPSPALLTQFGRLVIGDHNNNNGRMDLEIIYASVQ